MAAELTLLALPGDGIGPEIMGATLKVLRAAGAQIRVEEAEIGFPALRRHGTTIPQAVIDAARAADGVILGPVSHNAYPPVEEGGRNPSGVLRRELELFANIRPARSYPGLEGPCGGKVDLVVVRENLEGFYADRTMYRGTGEVMPIPGLALATRKVTEAGSRRIAEAAFALAETRAARKVTAIHKANVLRMSDGLFLDTVREVAAAHPEIAYDEVLVDAAAAHLVREPSRFDVLVATNMFGDILSDLASELAGGLGLAASLNRGAEHAVAQAQHGSAPDIAGQDRANPVSLILSAAMLLDHLGQPEPARRIEAAVHAALADPATRTVDLGGAMGTAAFTEHLCNTIGSDA
jgi:3-isopropylmalate dehydrogenase